MKLTIVIFTKVILKYIYLHEGIFTMKVAPILYTPTSLDAYVHGACVYGTLF
jgi:hypothetical protein